MNLEIYKTIEGVSKIWLAQNILMINLMLFV
jgi:hypothetical protein